jgi:hypothetical protein
VGTGFRIIFPENFDHTLGYHLNRGMNKWD